jgi:hypothetical protein
MVLFLTQKEHEKWLKDKSINPITGRKIVPGGRVYKQLENHKIVDAKICEEWEKNKNANPFTGSKINSSTRKRLEKLCINSEKCWNTKDPISLDDLDEKLSDEIIMIGSGPKKHRFLVENLYEYYKTQLLSNLPIRNPIDNISKLTDNEIKELVRKMKQIDPQITKIKISRKKSTYSIIYHMVAYHISNVGLVDFFNIFLIKKRNIMLKFLGLIPAFIDNNNIQSTDLTSFTMLVKLAELNEKNRLITENFLCNIHMIHNPQDWFENNRFNYEKFENLSYEIDQLL